METKILLFGREAELTDGLDNQTPGWAFAGPLQLTPARVFDVKVYVFGEHANPHESETFNSVSLRRSDRLYNPLDLLLT